MKLEGRVRLRACRSSVTVQVLGGEMFAEELKRRAKKGYIKGGGEEKDIFPSLSQENISRKREGKHA